MHVDGFWDASSAPGSWLGFYCGGSLDDFWVLESLDLLGMCRRF